jgi:hypothetical protein
MKPVPPVITTFITKVFPLTPASSRTRSGIFG